MATERDAHVHEDDRRCERLVGDEQACDRDHGDRPDPAHVCPYPASGCTAPDCHVRAGRADEIAAEARHVKVTDDVLALGRTYGVGEVVKATARLWPHLTSNVFAPDTADRLAANAAALADEATRSVEILRECPRCNSDDRDEIPRFCTHRWHRQAYGATYRWLARPAPDGFVWVPPAECHGNGAFCSRCSPRNADRPYRLREGWTMGEGGEPIPPADDNRTYVPVVDVVPVHVHDVSCSFGNPTCPEFAAPRTMRGPAMESDHSMTYTPATPVPMRGWGRVERWLNRHGMHRLAKMVGRYDERNLGR